VSTDRLSQFGCGQAAQTDPASPGQVGPPQNQIRLVLVDEQVLYRASLGHYLAAQPGLGVAGECGSSSEALEILSGSAVDIVILDLFAGTETGLISAARDAGYQGRFLIVAETADAREVVTALKLGASGIFLKSESPDRLVQAVRLVASGAGWVDQRIIHILADRPAGQQALGDQSPQAVLTEREQRVLLGILGGLTNRKIGDKLGLTEGAVRSVVQHLYVKVGVRTRAQLVRAALEGSLGAARELAEKRGIKAAAGRPHKPIRLHTDKLAYRTFL
jgi:DNA-binding NarL/FixJ family response regulator